MKVLLVVGVAVFAILSQIPCQEEVVLADQEVALKLSPRESYRIISDFFQYSKWMSNVDDVESGDLPSANYIGAEFQTTMTLPLFGGLEYRNTIIGSEFNQYFSFATNTATMVKYAFRVKPTDHGTSRVSLKVVSRRQNVLFKYVLSHLLKVYYNNGAIHTLMNLKMTYA